MDEIHKRVLKSGLLVIERRLHQMENQLLKDVERRDTIIYSVSDDLKSSTKTEMLEFITVMLHEIRQIKEVFKLEPSKESTRREIYGELSEIWVTLEELMPEKLESYGKVPETDGEMLRSHILTLIRRIDDVWQLLHNDAYIDSE